MPTNPADAAGLPLFRRFPSLARLPRAALGNHPTPLERLEVGGRALFLKRDDLSGSALGGNKVRGLEFLLGGVSSGDRIVTVGPRGSNHALATARYGRSLGADVAIVRWNQEMNPAARRVDALLRQEARVIDARLVAAAYAVAFLLRTRGFRWIPAGGASPLAVLGHVNAALELAEQLAVLPEQPDALFVPLGTGGTAAGVLLGLRIAGVRIPVHAVRVVPRIIGRVSRVLSLANATAMLIERLAGVSVPRPGPVDLRIEHAFYAGGYGRPLVLTSGEAAGLEAHGLVLDDTYSRKAFAAAIRSAASRPLFWVTFDGRVLHPEVP